MPIDTNGQWFPAMAPKQIEVYNDVRRHILLSGPRICGKTIVAIHKIIKHAWMHRNDRVGIFVKSTKIGKTGIWDDLISYALPEWCEGLEAEGFKITTGPAVDGATRMHYVRIANRHGGESEIQLHPLHHQDSVAEKMKGSRFGCILFDELDNYDNPEVFNVSVMQLRQIGLPREKHLWLGTCNPAGDQDHWIYQKFWVDPHDEKVSISARKEYGVHEFTLYDNPYIKPEDIEGLRIHYKNDPAMFQRYFNGLWVPDLRSVHFAGAFRSNFHVRGDLRENKIILPSEECSEILLGWDIGDRNHAVTFLEHIRAGANDYWVVLDELSHIGEDVSIETLTFEVMEKMEALASLCKKRPIFKHWSDRSAFDRYRSAADAKDHILVNRYSAGAIELLGAPKPPHSVAARLALVRQLLISEKLYFSAHCIETVEMMKKLTKGKTKSEPIKRDKHIHRFDALSYPLYAELISEIEESFRPNLKDRPKEFSLVN